MDEEWSLFLREREREREVRERRETEGNEKKLRVGEELKGSQKN